MCVPPHTECPIIVLGKLLQEHERSHLNSISINWSAIVNSGINLQPCTNSTILIKKDIVYLLALRVNGPGMVTFPVKQTI